jgi:hypothetical protein
VAAGPLRQQLYECRPALDPRPKLLTDREWSHHDASVGGDALAEVEITWAAD